MLKRIAYPLTPASISLFFVGLMFLLPALNMYHRLPINAFYTEWIAATLGLAALVPMLRKAQLSDISLPQISLVFLGLSIILVMQWIIGMLHSTQYALLVLSYLIWGFLLSLLSNHLRRQLG